MAAGDVITIVEDNLGKKGNYFDGTDDYVLVDAHAVERVAANDTEGTYSAWIYLDNYSSARTFISIGDNDSVDQLFTFGIDTSGRLSIYLAIGGVGQLHVRTLEANLEMLPNLKKWTHVACVQNGVQPKLYINGKLMTTENVANTDLTAWYDELSACDKFAIGILESNATHTNDFKGAIGQVKYWSRALSAAEVYKDFNRETLANGDYPEATYLRLNVTMEDDGTTDSGAGADNGTLTGD